MILCDVVVVDYKLVVVFFCIERIFRVDTPRPDINNQRQGDVVLVTQSELALTCDSLHDQGAHVDVLG